MITTYPTKTSSINPLLVLVLIVIVGGALFIASQHAREKHGSEADMVYRECGRNSLGSYLNPTNGRIANICQLQDGAWAVRIDADDGENVTAFIRYGTRTFREMISYLRSSGFTKNLGQGVFP